MEKRKFNAYENNLELFAMKYANEPFFDNIFGEITYAGFCKELQRLNPKAMIIPNPFGFENVISSIPLDKLILPQLFHLTGYKNGVLDKDQNIITNKYNTCSGVYLSVGATYEKELKLYQAKKKILNIAGKLKQKLISQNDKEM